MINPHVILMEIQKKITDFYLDDDYDPYAVLRSIDDLIINYIKSGQ